MDEQKTKESKYYKGDVDFTKEEIKTLEEKEYTVDKDNKSIAKKSIDGGTRTIHKQKLYTMKNDISYEVRLTGPNTKRDYKSFKDLLLFPSLAAALKEKLNESIGEYMKIETTRTLASTLLESVEERKEYKVKDMTFIFSHEDTDYGTLSYKSKDFYGDAKIYFDNGGAYGFTEDISKDKLEKLYAIVNDNNASAAKTKQEINKLLEVGKKQLKEAIGNRFEDKKYHVERKVVFSNLIKLLSRKFNSDMIYDAQEYVSILLDESQIFTTKVAMAIHPNSKGIMEGLEEVPFDNKAEESEYGYTFPGKEAQNLHSFLNTKEIEEEQFVETIQKFISKVKTLIIRADK